VRRGTARDVLEHTLERTPAVPHSPSPFNLDLIRASLGRELVSPYAAAFGAVPWLTAGTLAWPAEDAERVLRAFLAWGAPMLSAIRLGTSEIAIDVGAHGDPYGVPARLAPLRELAPGLDTVTVVAPAALRSRAVVTAVELPLGVVASVEALLDAARAMPDGVCLGVRCAAPEAVRLIALAPAGEEPRALAALDQMRRPLTRRRSARTPQ
jgi:hypothetical protein